MKLKRIAAIGSATLIALLAGCATTAPNAPQVPDDLQVPATQVLSRETFASGVQIYECVQNRENPTRYDWVFKAPQADLFDAAGRKIGKHYAGPTWESNDGSKVVGEIKARDDG